MSTGVETKRTQALDRASHPITLMARAYGMCET